MGHEVAPDNDEHAGQGHRPGRGHAGDAQFLADAARAGAVLSPLDGAQLQAVVRE